MTKVAKVSPEKELPGVLSGKIEKHAASASASATLSEAQVQDAVDSGTVVMKKRKKLVRYAMLLGYQGKNYYGMQVQSDLPTIESNLLRAMREYGVISEDEEKRPFSFYFQRAGRTDRAVSAVRQCCSMLLPLDEEFIKNGHDAINEHLPKDIRVLGIRRATPSFHAQKTCNARSYSYTLPTFAFADTTDLTNSKYRINDDRIKDVDEILAAFKGTHNFYNYTARREHAEASCNRYIIDFKCDKPFTYQDPVRNEEVEFLTVNIKGQSFMLHQIRKMIGITIAIVRRLAYRSDIQKSFEKYRMDVPKAPGLGLLLERVHYDAYDRKHGKTHESLDDWGEEVEARARKVRQELILPEILKTECETQLMMMWLASLVNHDFVCNPEDETGESKSVLGQAGHTARQASNIKEEEADGMNDDAGKEAVASDARQTVNVKEEDADEMDDAAGKATVGSDLPLNSELQDIKDVPKQEAAAP
ncbi:PUS-1 protein [Aphelenchoides avenae]|nr:PUS-1 protein [Aphelenchus avenae]